MAKDVCGMSSTGCFFKWCFFLRLSEFILSKASLFREFFPKHALAGMLCPSPWSCLRLVFQLVSTLGCCVRLPGLVCVLSPVLSPIWSPILSLSGLRSSPIWSPIWAGMLCPPPWSCLSLVSGLVSHLVSHLVFVWSPIFSHLVPHLGWYAVSTSLVLSLSGLRSCLPTSLSCLSLVSGLVFQLVSTLGCCVRLPGLVFVWSPVLSPIWSPILSLSGLRSSPIWSPIWAGMLCPPPWSCLCLVSGLVSQPPCLVFLSSPVLSSSLSPP